LELEADKKFVGTWKTKPHKYLRFSGGTIQEKLEIDKYWNVKCDRINLRRIRRCSSNRYLEKQKQQFTGKAHPVNCCNPWRFCQCKTGDEKPVENWFTFGSFAYARGGYEYLPETDQLKIRCFSFTMLGTHKPPWNRLNNYRQEYSLIYDRVK